MIIYTIGFTQSTAEHFFTRLIDANVGKLVDVRLNNTSQLSGFAKRDDLRYFLKQVARIEYAHWPMLAPTAEMLAQYRGEGRQWPRYARSFLALMQQRQIENIDRRQLDRACLLCSESLPDACHRRLAAEYLRSRWDDTEVRHL